MSGVKSGTYWRSSGTAGGFAGAGQKSILTHWQLSGSAGSDDGGGKKLNITYWRLSGTAGGYAGAEQNRFQRTGNCPAAPASMSGAFKENLNTTGVCPAPDKRPAAKIFLHDILAVVGYRRRPARQTKKYSEHTGKCPAKNCRGPAPAPTQIKTISRFKIFNKDC